ncbi:RHS repeat-associated core domain-containing protein [Xanthomonas sp. SI]|uniref:RHS repeat-associated core domain-containing protein n=1 Tax=Xanthomonas sp. SI TaxID=2724123 RepID=UPI00163AB8D3|nr:RHS repeat-associated core domain-containing protein [Xanthomonas sp. SI]QNH12446.1 hypothetical protein HEP75_01878 [Xanthomonas sp. SI]
MSIGHEMKGSAKPLIKLLWLLALALPLNAAAETVEYFHTDALGTPIAVTDASGNLIETSEYEPYGKLLNRPLTDGPGFTGHVQDAATGLTYMQQRYYDPVVGRFLSVDPVSANSISGDNFNRYWYGSNNPYRFFDSDGRCTGSHIANDDGTCVSSGDFTTGGSDLATREPKYIPYQLPPTSKDIFMSSSGAESEEPQIPLAESMEDLIINTYERVVRRTSFVADGAVATGGLGVDLEATKTTRPWQKDKVGGFLVFGAGAYLGANAKFRIFSWGDTHGTTGGKVKVSPLGYYKLRVGAGLSIGLSGSFNDHNGGVFNLTAGGGFGSEFIVKPPINVGAEKEL